MTLQIGTRLGHYRILALLGRGGMADVYRAEDERLGREVALKAVPPEFARDFERIERFRRAVRVAARLNHPNIVTMFELGHVHGHHFYTTELMTGGDLKARIRARPDGMDPGEAWSVALAMARALDTAHRQGFIHRDLKPENILFALNGKPKLAEFGIKRAMLERVMLERGILRAGGTNIGSPHYMSTEQARGLNVDRRSDLYSLGVVLYEMLTGRLPFDAPKAIDVLLSHINDPAPQLPGELAEWQPVLDRLLAKSPEERYTSAGELVGILAPDVLRNRTTGESRFFDGIEFVWIPASEFRMGSTGRHACSNEKPVTRVRITRGFWLGKYEVTQRQWQAVMGSNPSHFKNCGGNCPVENASWDDVQEFLWKLNARSDGRPYRLSTEAEWEYAARAGTTTDTYAGDITELVGSDHVLNKIAWYDENSGGRTHPVGRKAPNAWGLHDMLGNVWERVEDWYGDYPGGTVTDPVGPPSGSLRVGRGGSWDGLAWFCSSAHRGRGPSGVRHDHLGFRLLRE